MKMIRTIIIDDEPLALDLIKNFLSHRNDIDLIAEANNGFEALKLIHELKPDLIFLDIQMPKINGFELLEVLKEKPKVIFTTAFDHFALKAFEYSAVDYLLKPFSKERLFQAIDKVKVDIASPLDTQQMKLTDYLAHESKELERVVVRQGNKVNVIAIDKIYYLEAQDDYVMIYAENGNFLKEKTMKYFESSLPASFIRIHRSHIVNISQIIGIEQYIKNTHVVKMKCGASLKVSAEGYKKLKEQL